VSELTHSVEALLFVASQPLSLKELAALTDAPPERVERALDALGDRYGEGRSGVVLEHAAGGWGFRASRETAEVCARLVNRPSTKGLSQAALETLAIVAYLQPVSRPEVARIRGVASESATSALTERGLIEEAGRSQFGAVLYRTTPLFLKLFGLDSPDELPDPAQWDPSPEEAGALRDRLLRAGEARGEAAGTR
jgi:segregation and condensation protein B